MFLRKTKKGQSILEYTLLLGIVIAGILIMQHYVKRGFQGGLKDSADKMGDAFSAGGTTVYQSTAMTTDQILKEETATTAGGGTGISAFVSGLTGTVDKGVYVYSDRTGGDATIVQKTGMDAATQEKYLISDYQTTTATDFTSGNIDW